VRARQRERQIDFEMVGERNMSREERKRERERGGGKSIDER